MEYGYGVSNTTLGRLRTAGAPWALVVILRYLFEKMGPPQRQLDLLEMFSGHGELSRQFQSAGLETFAFDWDHDELLQDLTSNVGLINAVLQAQHPQQPFR